MIIAAVDAGKEFGYTCVPLYKINNTHMKKFLSIILPFFFCTITYAQQQEIIKLDSCNHFATKEKKAFDDIYVRPQQPAQWNMPKNSMTEFFQKYFKQYVQKTAGGRITISLLINEEGKCCFYQAQPNSNVRPNFNELKALLDQTSWLPAMQEGKAVKFTKVIFVSFKGKEITVTSID
jgi:hypothetical protein